MTHETIVRLQSFGEFDILFQYVNEEPALVVRTKRFLHARKRAWVVTLDSAWKYVDTENGDHSDYMVEATHKIGEMLGLGTSLGTRFSIAEGIVSCLEELINMKPYKRPDDAYGAEVQGTMMVGNQKISIEGLMENTVNPIDQQ